MPAAKLTSAATSTAAVGFDDFGAPLTGVADFGADAGDFGAEFGDAPATSVSSSAAVRSLFD